MNDIVIFTQGISAWQKEMLLAVFSLKKTLPARILCLVLEKNSSPQEIEKELGTTASTFNKACTQAKQELLAEIKRFTETPYDEIYLVKTLILNGHFNPAQKLITQLEKYFEEKQKWQHLELLYIEATRLCQATGDLKITATLSVKRVMNAERLKVFIELSTQLNKLLFEFEVYEKKKIQAHFLKELNVLLKKAQASKHVTLVHNALQLQYLYYSRYTNKYALAKKYAEAIYRNRQKNKARLDDLTSVLALNVYLNYLSIYTGALPRALINEVKADIEGAGKHALFNFHYILLDYYLYERNFKELDLLLAQGAQMNDNTKFTVYGHSILALKYFAEKNYALFKEHINTFYSNADRLDFPEAECLLRIVEALKLLVDKKEEDALYKLNSLRVFIDRNLSERYQYEREIVAFLSRYIKKDPREGQLHSFLQTLKKSPYRNIRYLESLLAGFLK